AGIRETDEAAPASLVEIDPRRCSNAGLIEHQLCEGEAVVRKLADVYIEVEGSVGRNDAVETGFRQLGQKKLAIGGIHPLVGLELRQAIESSQRSYLRYRRRRNVEILGQLLDGPHQLLGNDHPANPPAGHREVLGEAVYDHDVVGVLESRLRRHAVGQTMIDLIRDEPEPPLPA